MRAIAEQRRRLRKEREEGRVPKPEIMPDEGPVRAARGNLSERIPREEELDESMEEENRMRASETHAHPVTYVQQSSTLDGRNKEDSSSVIFIERKVSV